MVTWGSPILGNPYIFEHTTTHYPLIGYFSTPTFPCCFGDTFHDWNPSSRLILTVVWCSKLQCLGIVITYTFSMRGAFWPLENSLSTWRMNNPWQGHGHPSRAIEIQSCWYIYIYIYIYIYTYIIYTYYIYIYTCKIIWLVVWTLPLWKMMELKSVGIMKFPTEWKNKKCSKPPTSICIYICSCNMM